MPINTTDFYPFQIVVNFEDNTVEVIGSFRNSNRTIPGTNKRKTVSVPLPLRPLLNNLKTKISAKAAETGFVIRQAVININAADGGEINVEGYYELPNGTRTGTHVKTFRVNDLTAKEENLKGEPEVVILDPIGFTSTEITNFKNIRDSLKTTVRQEEGF